MSQLVVHIDAPGYNPALPREVHALHVDPQSGTVWVVVEGDTGHLESVTGLKTTPCGGDRCAVALCSLGRQPQRTPTPTPIRQPPTQPAQDYDRPSFGTELSERQEKAIWAISRANGIDADAWARRQYDRPVADLTRKEASELIDALKRTRGSA